MTPDSGIISQQNTQDGAGVLSLPSGWVLLTKVCRVVVGRAVQTQIPQIWHEIRDLSPVHALSLTQDVKLRGRKRGINHSLHLWKAMEALAQSILQSVGQSVGRPTHWSASLSVNQLACPLVSQLVNQLFNQPVINQSVNLLVNQPAS